jgi:hypothetical protein
MKIGERELKIRDLRERAAKAAQLASAPPPAAAKPDKHKAKRRAKK